MNHRLECQCEQCIAYYSDPKNPNSIGAAVALREKLDTSIKALQATVKELKWFSDQHGCCALHAEDALEEAHKVLVTCDPLLGKVP